MRLYINTTSPFVRIVRIALAEKGLAEGVELVNVDPWADPEPFLAANPAGRVPVLVTEDGTAIAESLLILRWLDERVAAPAVFPADGLAATLDRAGIALAAMEASTAIIIGRKSNPDFDTHMVGARRYRTIAQAFGRLDALPPRDLADRVDIANIAAVTLIDYVLMRYTDRDWLGPVPTLAAWHARQRDRPSLVATRPYV